MSPNEPRETIDNEGIISALVTIAYFWALTGRESLRVERDWMDFLGWVSIFGGSSC